MPALLKGEMPGVCVWRGVAGGQDANPEECVSASQIPHSVFMPLPLEFDDDGERLMSVSTSGLMAPANEVFGLVMGWTQLMTDHPTTTDIDFIKPLEKREVVDNNTRKSTDSIRPRAKRLRKEIINQTNRRERPASSLDRERYQQTLGGGV
ncbi:hypothetical protein BY996DRAFT_6472974 [Phakopsora pachyrhizi]|nr:hypothetical protein BY996DRAFT_6472974 [Phakopsora pachyrhizi]